MVTLQQFDLVLFDFDGLLVNTEHLHWEAYEQLCINHGLKLGWDFKSFVLACHREATGPRDAIYRRFPQLQEEEPNWDVLYREKSDIYMQLLEQGRVQLMPGVASVLQRLKTAGTKHAVVTHSKESHIALIRRQHPILDSIPHWITREHYTQPKPHPECYQTALSRLAAANDRVVGFEDTPRGIRALLGTRVQPVIVCPADYPLLDEVARSAAIHLTSLEQVA